MKEKKIGKSSAKEITIREQFANIIQECPIPKKDLWMNIPLFLNRQIISRVLFFQKVYKKILDVPGVIMEFGVLWGRDLVSLMNFRGIYEPYNYTRKIIGFDTFEGFLDLHEKDNIEKIPIKKGDFSTTEGYEVYLERLLQYHEGESPLSHIKRFELVKGDVRETLPKYLEDNPETIISLAYIDVDVYEPTKAILETIKPYLVKGSVIGFDELNFHAFPGETIAFNEVFGLNNYRLYRVPYDPISCYLVFGE